MIEIYCNTKKDAKAISKALTAQYEATAWITRAYGTLKKWVVVISHDGFEEPPRLETLPEVEYYGLWGFPELDRGCTFVSDGCEIVCIRTDYEGAPLVLLGPNGEIPEGRMDNIRRYFPMKEAFWAKRTKKAKEGQPNGL